MTFNLSVSKYSTQGLATGPEQIVKATVECGYGVILQALATFMNQVGGSHEEKRNWDDIVRLVDDRVRKHLPDKPGEHDSRNDAKLYDRAGRITIKPKPEPVDAT